MPTDFTPLHTELQKLAPTAVIELYVFDVTPEDVGSTNKYYFHSGTNNLSVNLTWQGQEYTAWPVEIQGFDRQIGGALPRLKVKMANISALFTALASDFDDMLGAKLTRKRTFAQFLDAVNFPGGVNATADPLMELPEDIFYLDRKANENKAQVELEFASKYDLEGVQIPRRQVTASLCMWSAYRGPGCRYNGRVVTDSAGVAITITPLNTYPFPEYDNTVAYSLGYCVWYLDPLRIFINNSASTGVLPTVAAHWTEDVCLKRICDCKLRPHSRLPTLPYGGFPGIAKLA